MGGWADGWMGGWDGFRDGRREGCGFSSRMKQNKKAKNCAVFCFAGKRKYFLFIYEVSHGKNFINGSVSTTPRTLRRSVVYMFGTCPNSHHCASGILSEADEHSTIPEEPLDSRTKWTPAWAMANMVKGFAKWLGVSSTMQHWESLGDEASNFRRTDANAVECDLAFTEMAHEVGDSQVQLQLATLIEENSEMRAASKQMTESFTSGGRARLHT
jgi:hypothetical protein